MLTPIGLFLKGIGGKIWGIWDWFYNKATLKLKMIILAVLAGLLLLGYILYLQHKAADLGDQLEGEKLERKLDNVNALTNQITELEREGNVLKANANAADADRRAVDNRDSSTFNGANNKSRFCARNPTDSLCR